MGKTTKMYDRKFLGDMDLLFLSKEERKGKEEQIKFEKAHLKAYIKGHDQFKFGKELDKSPKWHVVKQELTINK